MKNYEVHLNMNALYLYFYVIEITLWLIIGSERKHVNQSKLYITQVIASKVRDVNHIVHPNYSTVLEISISNFLVEKYFT